MPGKKIARLSRVKGKGFSMTGLEKRLKKLRTIKEHESISHLIENPYSFKTKTGSKVQILRHGFSNIYKGQRHNPARALVLAFVDGKKLFFYRSSGEGSLKKGQWFPTQGPKIQYLNGEKNEPIPCTGWMIKMQGHPKPLKEKPGIPTTVRELRQLKKRSYFPATIGEIREKLKRIESQLELHDNWDLRQYTFIIRAFEKVPFSDKIKPE